MNNVVVEAVEHGDGAKIIEFFASKGINTGNFVGSNFGKDGDEKRFYGVVDGHFAVYSKSDFARIVTLEDLKNNSKQKSIEQMKVFKTKEVTIEGQKRTIVIATVIDNGLVKTGYSVCMPDDKFNPEMGERIALGRAMKDKTNLTPDMVMGVGMDKKYILYAIAEHFLKVVSDGKVVKGIKQPKVNSVEAN